MTKLYLHAASSSVTGTLPTSEQSTLTADTNLFTGEDGTANRLMDTTIGISQANLTNASTGDTNAHNYYIARWVSPLLYQTNILAKTWTFEFGAKESNAAANFPRSSTGVLYVNCYIWKPSDGTKVGTILDGNTNSDGEEATTSQTVINCTFAGAAVTGMTPGDAVLIVEMWAQVTQGTSTSRTQDVYFDGTTENSTSSEAAFLSTPEDLLFTETADNELITSQGGSTASTANTTEYWTIAGRPTVSTTENDVKIVVRKAGTVSKLSVKVTANTISGTTTFTLMKNGSPTALVASATATGAALWEDLTHNVTVAAGDLLSIKSVPGGATGTFVFGVIGMNFVADDGTSVQILASAVSTTISAASTTVYIPLNGANTTTATEANAKVRQRKHGKYQYLYVYVTANARTTNTVFKTRKNGGDGNISVTYGNAETGVKEDSSNIDTIAIGDDYNLAITTSTGTENLTFTVIAVEFLSDDFSGELVTSLASGTVCNANTTTNFITGGRLNNFATEADSKRRMRISNTSFQQAFVYISANTVSADSTLKLRKNGANGNISITITANTTGWFSDTSNTDTIGSGDDINWQLITGATGTSLTINTIVVFYRTTSSIAFSRTQSTETTNLSESIARLLGASRSLSTETTNLSESTARLYAASRALGTETTTADDSVATIFGLVRALDTETTTLTEDITRAFAGSRSLATETTTSSEDLARLYTASRTLGTETTDLSENIEAQLGKSRPLDTETTTTSEDLARLYGANRQLSTETTSLSESLDKVFIGTRTLATESTTSSENLERVYSASRTLDTETTALSENLVREFTGSRTLGTESTSLSEDLSRLYNAGRPLDTEITSLSESITREFAGARSLPETVANSESINRLLAAIRTLDTEETDSTDDLSKVFTGVRTLPTETVTSSESLARVYNAIRNITTQVISVVDDLVGELGETSGEFFANLEETVSTSDSINRLKTTTRTLSQTVTSTSLLARKLGVFRTLEDTTAVSDLVEKLRNVTKQLEDTIEVTDSIVRAFTGSRIITELILSKSRVQIVVNNFLTQVREGKPYLKVESKSVRVLDVVRKYGIVAPKRIIRGSRVEGKH